MAIQFACQCGKTLKATDEHAGKRAKCNQCGQVVTIPGTPRKSTQAASKPASPTAPPAKKAASTGTSKAANPFGLDDLFSSELPLGQPMGLVSKPATSNPSPAAPAQAGGSRCPSCQSPLAAAAVLCVNCGYNLSTGKKTTTFSYTPSTYVEAPKKRPRSRVNQVLISRLTSWKLWSGSGMVLVSVFWCYYLLHSETMFAARQFGAMGVLFFVGAISIINGLFDGDSAE